MTRKQLKAFIAGFSDYGVLYPRQYVSFKEYRAYMKGRRWIATLKDIFQTRRKV